jgi:transcription-repair coupling factor (superfamily II helicase)
MQSSIPLTSRLPKSADSPIYWSGLTGCGDSLALANTIAQENRLLVIITPDTQTALRLEHELAFFLNDSLPILHFPDWETLPYDVFRFYPDAPLSPP